MSLETLQVPENQFESDTGDLYGMLQGRGLLELSDGLRNQYLFGLTNNQYFGSSDHGVNLNIIEILERLKTGLKSTGVNPDKVRNLKIKASEEIKALFD